MNFSDSFRAARWMRFINLILQALLFLALFAGLNYLALKHSWRFDLSQSRQHSLSTETLAYLDSLKRDVTVTVTISDDELADDEVVQSYREISTLLREYAYRTAGKASGKVEVRFLDVYKNGRKAAELNINLANVVVLDSGTSRTVLTSSDFYRYKNKKRDAFKGEATLTAALLDVSNPDKKKVYFISGHGEMSPFDTSPQRGLSQLHDELRARNFDVAQLDLSLTRRIPPEENALLIIAAPQRRFQLYEEILLRDYLSTRAGRVILMLDSRANVGLDNLFFDWGVMVHNTSPKIIIDPHNNSITETNDLRIWTFAADPDSKITDIMTGAGLVLQLGETRIVGEDISRPSDDGLRVKRLAVSSAEAWGESNFYSQPVFTPGQDLVKGPQGAFVISERLKPANDLPLSVRGGRLAVFGTGEIVNNRRIDLAGNLGLFLATVKWAADSDVPVSVPVRPIQRYSLSLSQEDVLRLRLGLLLIVPGIVAIIGIIVYWTRRD
ncbi:Gldg family protein [Oleiharenicola lentus]|uniref:Gldg family protein n=1 Tax=Oleiharenicola lentus TaxID=2508720 RepID=UPI003F660D2C